MLHLSGASNLPTNSGNIFPSDYKWGNKLPSGGIFVYMQKKKCRRHVLEKARDESPERDTAIST